MKSKPKNFSDAIERLADLAGAAAADLKPQLEDAKTRVQDEAAKAKGKVEVQIKENPWVALGVVGLIFLVIGILFGSRRKD